MEHCWWSPSHFTDLWPDEADREEQKAASIREAEMVNARRREEERVNTLCYAPAWASHVPPQRFLPGINAAPKSEAASSSVCRDSCCQTWALLILTAVTNSDGHKSSIQKKFTHTFSENPPSELRTTAKSALMCHLLKEVRQKPTYGLCYEIKKGLRGCGTLGFVTMRIKTTVSLVWDKKTWLQNEHKLLITHRLIQHMKDFNCFRGQTLRPKLVKTSSSSNSVWPDVLTFGDDTFSFSNVNSLTGTVRTREAAGRSCHLHTWETASVTRLAAFWAKCFVRGDTDKN